MDEFIIRPLEAGDYADWHGVWQEYCTFYKVRLPEAVTRRTWDNLIDPVKPSVRGWGAVLNGRVVGIAHVIEHENTWESSPVAYLEDIAVASTARGRGIGRKLLQRVVDDAKAQGLSRLYWLTQKSNHTARQLYDSFTPVDDEYVRYMMRLHPPRSSPA
jgi:GNAT superfamily N-acetyltransferase